MVGRASDSAHASSLPQCCCCVLQCVWRGRRIRRVFQTLYLRATAAAMRIQAVARGNSVRRFIAYHKVGSESEATVLSFYPCLMVFTTSSWIGFRLRSGCSYYVVALQWLAMTSSAIRFQAAYRGWRGRCVVMIVFLSTGDIQVQVLRPAESLAGHAHGTSTFV